MNGSHFFGKEGGGGSKGESKREMGEHERKTDENGKRDEDVKGKKPTQSEKSYQYNCSQLEIESFISNNRIIDVILFS